MSLHIRVRKNCYQDSVKLMQITQSIKTLPGISRASAIMGTENNKATLIRGGFDGSLMDSAGPSDILFIVDGNSDASCEEALDRYQSLVDEVSVSPGTSETPVRSIASAVSIMPTANFALISVPGEYAAYEAYKALRAGLNVQIFSDNVSIEDEVKLKELGRRLGLLVMGPDCGTSIIGSTPIGFANVVSSGPIGIVGASGTGMQEVSVLIDRFGSGISHAIGLGGRDLSDRVGGISALMALDLLEKDQATKVVVLVSKPAGAATGKNILKRLKSYTKPVVIAFLGGDMEVVKEARYVAANLEQAARMAVELATSRKLPDESSVPGIEELRSLVSNKPVQDSGSRKHLCGLFTGGSLADEALLILTRQIGTVYSNLSTNADHKIKGSETCPGHGIIDMGDDEFTIGRPHPMIDPTYRAERIMAEWADPEIAVILCDVVLGYGSHHSPATPIVEAVEQARARYGDGVCVVASVCGTEKDPQQLSVQERLLREAGILVLPTNASAARTAGQLVEIYSNRSVH